MNNKFWMIYSDAKIDPTCCKYDNRKTAENDAERFTLATGFTFYVLEAVSGFSITQPSAVAFKTIEAYQAKEAQP